MSNLKNKRRKSLIGGALFIFLSIGVIASVSQFGSLQKIISQATGKRANFIIDTQATIGPINQSWRNLAQGGESHNWRLAPINNLVQSLNPKYIRIDHIYDFYDIVQGSPGNIHFNFTKFDLILNDILEAGAKPYISLSYMPPAISQGDIVQAPYHWSDWQLTVQGTIEYISGTRAVEDVYYEVWNEPDLFGDWNYYGAKNYLTMYTHAALGARNAQQNPQVKNFYLGGPSTTTLYKNWFDAMARHAINNNLKYDFFSWHRYSHNLNILEKDLTQIQSWLARYPQLAGLELHVTEWGLDSANHPGYDSAYGAAHVVAGAITLNQLADKAFVFEIQDGKDPNNQVYWGRWGLLTHQDFGSQPKPRYHGLLMLDRISGQQLRLTGQGTWVKAIAARNDRGNIELIIANADQHHGNSEIVPITFINIESGNYILNLEYLDGRRQTISATATENSLQTEITMTPNTVVHAELIML